MAAAFEWGVLRGKLRALCTVVEMQMAVLDATALAAADRPPAATGLATGLGVRPLDRDRVRHRGQLRSLLHSVEAAILAGPVPKKAAFGAADDSADDSADGPAVETPPRCPPHAAATGSGASGVSPGIGKNDRSTRGCGGGGCGGPEVAATRATSGTGTTADAPPHAAESGEQTEQTPNRPTEYGYRVAASTFRFLLNVSRAFQPQSNPLLLLFCAGALFGAYRLPRRTKPVIMLSQRIGSLTVLCLSVARCDPVLRLIPAFSFFLLFFFFYTAATASSTPRPTNSSHSSWRK